MILRLGMDAPNGQGGLCQILLLPHHPIRLPFVSQDDGGEESGVNLGVNRLAKCNILDAENAPDIKGR
jgi:hypothetical protein